MTRVHPTSSNTQKRAMDEPKRAAAAKRIIAENNAAVGCILNIGETACGAISAGLTIAAAATQTPSLLIGAAVTGLMACVTAPFAPMSQQCCIRTCEKACSACDACDGKTTSPSIQTANKVITTQPETGTNPVDK
ncbi:MAG: hypothetical protein O3A01_00550 [bacterium]|nr:hypothetical protein [bacterium]